MDVERHSGSESEDEEFSPEEEVVDEPQFTTDEIEDELSDDADAIAHLEQEMQAAGLRQRVARGAEDDEGDDITPAAVSPSGRPMRGAAVRATKAIAEQRETRSVRSSGGRSGLFAAVGLLALLVLAFVAATYLESRSSVSEESCGLQVHEFTRALTFFRYASELHYAKAQYAPSMQENLDQLSKLLFAKKDARPTVVLFVSGNSPERRQAMNTFVEGLASIFYNQTNMTTTTTTTNFYKFDDPKATSSLIQKPIVDRLRVCNRGLFAINANVMLEHFDLLETAMEDNVAYIVASNGEQVPTNGAVFIVMATLPEEVLRRLARETNVESVVAQQVMDKHRPRWTKRFSQRLQGVFIF